MGAGALLRDGKVQMSQILVKSLPGRGTFWGRGRGARGLEKERRREVPRPLSCQPPTVGFSLFGNASA